MPEIKITKSETIPSGMYRFKVTGAELRTSENSKYGDGNFIGWQLLVGAGPNPDDVGKMIFHATGTQFGNKSAGYRFLCALGMPETDKVASINTDDYVQREFVGKVTEKEKDGNKVNKIEEFYSIEEYRQMQSPGLTNAAGQQAPPTSPPPVAPPPVAPPPVTQPATPANNLLDDNTATPPPPPPVSNNDDLEFPKG